MYPSASSPVLFLIVAVVLLVLVWKKLVGHGASLPPGPFGAPLIGSAWILLNNNSWFKFSELAKKYGDIFMLRVFGKKVIVINNFELAQELLDRRGSSFSDRPRMVVISELFKVISVTFLPYGDRWRQHRRMMHKYFNSRSVTSFQMQQTKQARFLLHDLLAEPTHLRRHIQKFATATIVGLTYGGGIMSDEKYMNAVDSATVVFNEAGAPGISLLDLFPPLRFLPSFFPGCAVKKNAKKIGTILRNMTDHPFQSVIEQRDLGTAPPSLVSRMLSDYEQKHVTDMEHVQVMKEVAASMYRAGAATTDIALQTFFLLIPFHPHVAQRARQELDALLRGERLPKYEDRPNLPYVNCILKEVLRWNPPLPVGLPHRGIAEDVVAGKRIPKGSIIVANIWHMMHDPRNYANPHLFNPDRFLHNPKLLDPSAAVFGFGRRICPGRHFADASLFLAIAHVLSVYDILPPLPLSDGEPTPVGTELSLAYAKGPNMTSLECRVIPRSEKASRLVEEDRATHRREST